MSSTAKLYRRAILDDAHLVAILLAEESHCTKGFSLGDRHISIFATLDCCTHVAVCDSLHLADFLGGHLLEVGEVEAEHVVAHIGAFLLHMSAKHLAKSLVEKVGGRVVAADSLACLLIDKGVNRLGNILGHTLHDVHREVVLALGVDYFHGVVATDEHAFVANLAAHFGVERSLGEYHLIKLVVLLLHLTVAEYFGVDFLEVISHKLGFAFAESHPVGSLHGSGVAGAVLLLLHLGVEAVDVGSHSVFL